MGQRGVLRTIDGGRLGFICPGCGCMHAVTTRGSGEPGRGWEFNGNYDHPTFRPSILVTGVEDLTEHDRRQLESGEVLVPRPYVCHSYVTDGRIEFLTDCTHSMAGQTVPIRPDLG